MRRTVGCLSVRGDFLVVEVVARTETVAFFVSVRGVASVLLGVRVRVDRWGEATSAGSDGFNGVVCFVVTAVFTATTSVTSSSLLLLSMRISRLAFFDEDDEGSSIFFVVFVVLEKKLSAETSTRSVDLRFRAVSSLLLLWFDLPALLSLLGSEAAGVAVAAFFG